MKITWKQKVEDPPYPIMHGKTPLVKEFNKRQAELWKDGKFTAFDYEQVTTVLLEILGEDYDKRHATRKRNHKNSHDKENQKGSQNSKNVH